MPRKFFKRYMPGVDRVRQVRALHLFGDALFHPALWHLNRRSAAGGVAVGLFCGLIPGPLQMLGAGIAAVLFRVNLPAALLSTLYTNPITIVPLYLVAYKIGNLVLGAAGGTSPMPPPAWNWSAQLASVEALGNWAMSLGAPLALGVFLLACLLALAGYLIVRVLWNIHLRRAWIAPRWHAALPFLLAAALVYLFDLGALALGTALGAAAFVSLLLAGRPVSITLGALALAGAFALGLSAAILSALLGQSVREMAASASSPVGTLLAAGSLSLACLGLLCVLWGAIAGRRE